MVVCLMGCIALMKIQGYPRLWTSYLHIHPIKDNFWCFWPWVFSHICMSWSAWAKSGRNQLSPVSNTHRWSWESVMENWSNTVLTTFSDCPVSLDWLSYSYHYNKISIYCYLLQLSPHNFRCPVTAWVINTPYSKMWRFLMGSWSWSINMNYKPY